MRSTARPGGRASSAAADPWATVVGGHTPREHKGVTMDILAEEDRQQREEIIGLLTTAYWMEIERSRTQLGQ